MGYLETWNKILAEKAAVTQADKAFEDRLTYIELRAVSNAYWRTQGCANQPEVEPSPELLAEYTEIRRQTQGVHRAMDAIIRDAHLEMDTILSGTLPGLEKFITIYHPTDDGWGTIDLRVEAFKWLDQQLAKV